LTFDDSSDILSTAIGWAYNSRKGEWFGNVICPDKKSPLLLKSGYIPSQYYQNFITMQTKSLTFENSKYYVIIVEKCEGQYKYPSIQKDWIESKERYGFIYTEKEYSKIKNINGKIEINAIGRVRDIYDEDMLDEIRSALMKKEGPDYIYNEYSDIFPILKSEEGMIRFYIPTGYPHTTKIDFEHRILKQTRKISQKLYCNRHRQKCWKTMSAVSSKISG
jgi:hypothetical protein